MTSKPARGGRSSADSAHGSEIALELCCHRTKWQPCHANEQAPQKNSSWSLIDM